MQQLNRDSNNQPMTAKLTQTLLKLNVPRTIANSILVGVALWLVPTPGTTNVTDHIKQLTPYGVLLLGVILVILRLTRPSFTQLYKPLKLKQSSNTGEPLAQRVGVSRSITAEIKVHQREHIIGCIVFLVLTIWSPIIAGGYGITTLALGVWSIQDELEVAWQSRLC